MIVYQVTLKENADHVKNELMCRLLKEVDFDTSVNIVAENLDLNAREVCAYADKYMRTDEGQYVCNGEFISRERAEEIVKENYCKIQVESREVPCLEAQIIPMSIEDIM